MWTLHKQPQHCGAQLPERERARRPGEPPAAATRDRAAQEHDRAGDTLQPGAYPASPIEHRDHDTAPTAPGDPSTGLRTGTRVEWDEVVQPERQPTELEQDERDDAAKRERAVEQEESDDAAGRAGR